VLRSHRLSDIVGNHPSSVQAIMQMALLAIWLVINWRIKMLF